MRSAAGVLGLLALSGCGAPPPATTGSSVAAPRPTMEPAAPPPPSSALPAEPAASREARRAIARTLSFIAELRELPAKREVIGEELTREQMVAHVKRAIREEVPPAVIRATNEFLFLAGVVERDFDFERSLLSVLGTELAGFYDPKLGRMYLGAELGVNERQATLLHELVHALQDQHYGLAELTRWRPDVSDRNSALHSLAEGDATSTMLDGLMFGTGQTALDMPEEALIQQIEQMQGVDPAVPELVKRSVVAPYVDGLRFVNALRKRGGWALVDASWREPPASTEQVLHPEKYLAREAVVPVPIPPPPPAGPRTLLYRDIEGEQALRLLFEEWLPRAEAGRAASDWGGDRLALYSDGGGSAFSWHIVFDTGSAAERGFSGVQAWVKGSRLDPHVVCRERAARGAIGAMLDGKAVAVVAGPGNADCAVQRRWLSATLAP